MPEYRYPGTYVEDSPLRAAPIQGVSTNIAGMLGLARQGPVNEPKLLHSYRDFTREFGDPYPSPSRPGEHLGHAVRAFFENGGGQTYVLRAADDAPEGNAAFVEALDALGAHEDISLMAAPGITNALVQRSLIARCEPPHYRFAILDGPASRPAVSDLVSHREQYESSCAAYYAPWLRAADPTTGTSILLPPSGHVLGICSRVDVERGVHHAPANELVRGILDVEVSFTDAQQALLQPAGINLIRKFEGRGIRLWGVRTLSSDATWKYVNVRRLFIYLEQSIEQGTRWAAFEPNAEPLWARVRLNIENFLLDSWMSGALPGSKPEDAFFVRCDRTSMTEDDLDQGRTVCLIGFAPLRPAEFVVFRLIRERQ